MRKKLVKTRLLAFDTGNLVFCLPCFSEKQQGLTTCEKWHMLERLVPLVENNYNLCELGPRGTGKSHVYKEISPNAILISGGQTTVANLFYNMSNRAIGNHLYYYKQ